MKFLRLKIVLVSFLLITGLIFFSAGNSHAIPKLQLDIAGGTYDASTGTIVANANSFTLYAYLIPNGDGAGTALLTDKYYISAAVAPKYGPTGGTLGSFEFDGMTTDVTSEMTYGNPPLHDPKGANYDPLDLEPHGIFDTYYTEYEFKFDSKLQIDPYNTQDRAKNSTEMPSGGSGMYYMEFTVDTSGLLASGYSIHFDLYNTVTLVDTICKKHGKKSCNVYKAITDLDVKANAPFSHDAESRHHQVPEPSTVLILGSGLIGLWASRRFFI